MAAKDYASKDLIVSYDATRCIHAGECARGAPAVFDPRRAVDSTRERRRSGDCGGRAQVSDRRAYSAQCRRHPD